MAQKKKISATSRPTTSLRRGSIRASIWETEGTNGPFFAATFSRSFRDRSGAWRNGASFGVRDVEDLLITARDAKEWIDSHRRSIS